MDDLFCFSEAALRSGGRTSDILDPSSINLAPVPDLYQAFMKTLLKPAPKPRNTAPMGEAPGLGRNKSVAASSHRKGTGKRGSAAGGGGDGRGAMVMPSTAVIDEGLLAALATKFRGGESS